MFVDNLHLAEFSFILEKSAIILKYEIRNFIYYFLLYGFCYNRGMKITAPCHFALAIIKDNTPDRNFIEGVAAFTEEQPLAQFQIVPPESLEREIRRDHFDGILCRLTNDRLAQLVVQKRLPTIDILNTSFKSDLPRIISDNLAIGRLAAEHFLERGFKNFAFFGYQNVNYSRERRDGFQARLAQNGYQAQVYDASPNSWRKYGHVTMPGYSRRTSTDEHRLLKFLSAAPKPLAAFCCHDPRAICVLDACKRAGLAIPQEVAILGVDNDSVHCYFSSPKLSSIDPDAKTIGYEAARRLFELHSNPRSAQLHQPLRVPPLGVIVRESSEIYPIDPMWLSDALVFIKRNATRGISALDVFNYLGLSHTYVQAVFRKVLHTSVQKTIIAERMAVAGQLLKQTQLPIATIAARAGFASSRYFCQAFTHQHRQSPSAWRQASGDSGMKRG